jgi:hypothetical protein
MAKKNRELQRVPPASAQKSALQRRMKHRISRLAVSGHPVYGALRAQLELVLEADALAPTSRGRKPERTVLLRLLAALERDGLAIRTNYVSPIVKRLAAEVHLSAMQVRDRLHQLAGMAEKLETVDLTKPKRLK